MTRMPALKLQRTPRREEATETEDKQGVEEGIRATHAHGCPPGERLRGHLPAPQAAQRVGQLRTPPVDEQQPTQMSQPPHNLQHADELEGRWGLLAWALPAAPTPRGEPPSEGSDGARSARGVLNYPALACAVRVALHWKSTGTEAPAQGAPVFDPELMLLSVQQRRPGDAVEQVYFDYFAGMVGLEFLAAQQWHRRAADQAAQEAERLRSEVAAAQQQVADSNGTAAVAQILQQDLQRQLEMHMQRTQPDAAQHRLHREQMHVPGSMLVVESEALAAPAAAEGEPQSMGRAEVELCVLRQQLAASERRCSELQEDARVARHAAELLRLNMAARSRLGGQQQQPSGKPRNQEAQLEQQAAKLRDQEAQLEQQAAKLRDQEARLEQQAAKLRDQEARLEQQAAKLRDQEAQLEQKEHELSCLHANPDGRGGPDQAWELLVELHERERELEEARLDVDAAQADSSRRFGLLNADHARLQRRVELLEEEAELSALEIAAAQERADKLYEWLEREHEAAEYWKAEAAKARLAQPPACSAAAPTTQPPSEQARGDDAAPHLHGADDNWLVARVVELTWGCRRLEEARDEGEARLDDALAVVEEQLGELDAKRAEVEELRERGRRLSERVAELEGTAAAQQPALSASMSKRKRRKSMQKRGG